LFWGLLGDDSRKEGGIREEKKGRKKMLFVVQDACGEGENRDAVLKDIEIYGPRRVGKKREKKTRA